MSVGCDICNQATLHQPPAPNQPHSPLRLSVPSTSFVADLSLSLSACACCLSDPSAAAVCQQRKISCCIFALPSCVMDCCSLGNISRSASSRSYCPSTTVSLNSREGVRVVESARSVAGLYRSPLHFFMLFHGSPVCTTPPPLSTHTVLFNHSHARAWVGGRGAALAWEGAAAATVAAAAVGFGLSTTTYRQQCTLAGERPRVVCVGEVWLCRGGRVCLARFRFSALSRR